MPKLKRTKDRASFGSATSVQPVGDPALRARSAIAALFIASALVFGGGGSSAPLSELILQLLAGLAALAWLLTRPVSAGARGTSGQSDRQPWVLAGLVLVLPCLQLLPLPPAVWQGLPGREQQQAAMELIGAGSVWMPWSVSPTRTFASLLALMPPLLAMGMVAGLDRTGRLWVIATIAGVAVISLLLGALQLSGGDAGGWQPYRQTHQGYLTGFQANRNAQADVLLIGMTACAAALRGLGDRQRRDVKVKSAVLVVLVVLFVLGCILTGSRAGMALLPVALTAIAMIWLQQPGVRGRAALIWSGALLCAGAAVLFALRQTTTVGRALERFALERDFRWEIWQDTQYAILQHWSFGSGIGSFRPVFFAAERLEVVDPSLPVRAHNDYLELALEGGIFGLLVLGCAAIWLGRMALGAWRRRDDATRPQIIFALAVFVVVALHSIVDYPLRSMALACLAGVGAGLLSAAPSVRRPEPCPDKSCGNMAVAARLG
jgi:exopolysaccharide production protein ExoQ